MRLRKAATATNSQSDDATPIESSVRSPLRGWWIPRAVAGGLWMLVAAAVAFSVLAWARPAASSPPAQVIKGEEARWDVAGFAELFVAEFVEAGDGEEAQLAAFLGGVEPVSLSGTTPGAWFVSSTATTSIVSTGDDRWRATVAVDLVRAQTDREPDVGYVSLGVRFFEVEVIATNSGLSAGGLPWIAPPPKVGEPPPSEWDRAEVPASDDPMADSVERFLNALLTGNGELGRYAAPGSDLRAVPATFESVSLERIAQRKSPSGGRWVRVWATAESAGLLLWLSYDLRVEERDGRWEIAAIGPEPVAVESSEIPAAELSTVPVGGPSEGN